MFLITFNFIFSVALAVLLDFLLQITAFVALVTFDFMRAEDNRIDCFPCMKVTSSSIQDNDGNDITLMDTEVVLHLSFLHISNLSFLSPLEYV